MYRIVAAETRGTILCSCIYIYVFLAPRATHIRERRDLGRRDTRSCVFSFFFVILYARDLSSLTINEQFDLVAAFALSRSLRFLSFFFAYILSSVIVIIICYFILF